VPLGTDFTTFNPTPTQFPHADSCLLKHMDVDAIWRQNIGLPW